MKVCFKIIIKKKGCSILATKARHPQNRDERADKNCTLSNQITDCLITILRNKGTTILNPIKNLKFPCTTRGNKIIVCKYYYVIELLILTNI